MPSLITSQEIPRSSIDGTKMQLECLELAGCTLDRYICAENAKPSFLEITGIASQRAPTCSGLNTGDYKNLALLLNHPNLSQLKIVNKVPLPPEIMEHFAHMQCHCLMGVFPEISRVWLTIDSNIYVWAFEHGSDVAYFDGLGETIVSVGLVKPKSGVFQSFVKYLLVLTTTVEIVVLGVTFSSSQPDGTGVFEEMQLVPEPVFVLPTDGVCMMTIKSTDDGRIFMGGKDGCLYEITYQAQLGWFGKHCKKVNHSTSALSFLVPSFLNAALYDEDPIVKIEIDNSRHILYTLSEKGCIEVFDLGANADSISKVTRLTQGKIVSLATDIVKTLEGNNFKPVIAISAVDEFESEHLNLVAVTQSGARLYFSTRSLDFQGSTGRPIDLTLLHVRLPPGFTPNASVLKPKQVHNAVYQNGTLVMVCGGGADAETLWCLSRALPAAALSEAHSLLPLDGPAWALAELPTTHAPQLSPPMLAKKDPWRISRWAAVTSAGAVLLAAGGASDLLRTLLVDCRGPDAQQVKDFFQLQSTEQACACALHLACEDMSSDPTISEWAARAFYLYGSQPSPAPMYPQHPSQIPTSTTFGSPKFSPRQMSTPMTMRGAQQAQMNQSPHPHQYQQGMNQSYTSPNLSLAQSPYSPSNPIPFNQSNYGANVTQQHRDTNCPIQIEYSAKHNAFYIYIGRILIPIWNLKCVSKSKTPDNSEFMSSTVTGEDCAYIVQKLHRIAAFMNRAVAPPNSEEQASLHALRIFVNMAVEMLSLWKVLCEHQFHVIAASLPPEQQNALQAASFRELLFGGQEVACLLLSSLVAGYLRDNASVDGISQKLRQLCPTLYRSEDATCSKANELLIFAKQQSNPAEKEEMLHNALKLCMDVAPNVNLPLVCSKLVSAGFYTGVVDLCVACARKIDPQNKALHYYKSDQQSQDREGHLTYYRRMEIYREVCSALERLYEQGENGAAARGAGAGAGTAPPSTPASPSRGMADPIPTLTPADADCLGRKLVWECLSRDDELLHVAVYEWLVTKRLGSELLSLGASPPSSLRGYLSRAAAAAPPPAALQLSDLLWKVLERQGDHLAAAHVLEGLATTPGTGATLEQRISWLSSGVVCVRGAGAAGAAGGSELLRRLEEAREVARVQRTVRAALCALPAARAPAAAAVRRLDDALLDITQLYEEYADRYNLWECKLAIVQCSGHNDRLLVENIWSNILAEAETAASNLANPDERMNCVLSKLTTLGKEYVNTGHCFPLYFIVRQLEITSCKLRADKRMVFNTVLSIGVSLEQVLDIYIKLVSVNERVWLSHGDEGHVCGAAASLLERAPQLVCALPPAPRRRALQRCKDLHEATLSAAQARPNTQRLIDRLSVAQGHLDRLD